MVNVILKTFKPRTQTLRGTVLVSAQGLSKVKPFKGLTKGLNKKSGRDNHGHISTRHKGGGAKQSYRQIAFKRGVFNTEGVIKTIEYDPNRTAFISLVEYSNGKFEYIITPQDIKVGDVISTSEDATYQNGASMPLKKVPVGTNVYNIELKPGAKAKLVRSAGVCAKIVSRETDHVKVQLPSGEVKEFNPECYASIGAVSNPLKKNEKVGKAGRARRRGIRPSVRGVAMNPVDHPHGGGEGKKSGGGSSGKHPVTPWGKKTKGLKTRRVKPRGKSVR